MSEGNYRLKQEVITDFMRQRMPTLCETEKPLKWWLDNKIVPNDEDLEPCEGNNANARTELSINYDGLLATGVCDNELHNTQVEADGRCHHCNSDKLI